MAIDGPVTLEQPAPTRAEQLNQYVDMRTKRGDDAAEILAGALRIFGEEPPARCT